MKTGNYLIDGDDGSNCQSPLHRGCKNCEEKEIGVCSMCLEYLKEEEEEICEECKKFNE
jgi:hypothetical protein